MGEYTATICTVGTRGDVKGLQKRHQQEPQRTRWSHGKHGQEASGAGSRRRQERANPPEEAKETFRRSEVAQFQAIEASSRLRA
jgi:hypothetical protein